MRKFLASGLALVLVLSMAGCTERETVDNVKTTGMEEAENEGNSNNIVLKSPPILNIICGELSKEALLGTYSWSYQNKDGTSTGIEADSMHPLDAKDYMTPVRLVPSTLSHIDPLTAYLQFEIAPDTVSVRCWGEDCWGQVNAVGEEISVSDYDGGESEPMFRISLKDSNCIYEVTAEWNSSGMYGGTAYYSFYTIKEDYFSVSRYSNF